MLLFARESEESQNMREQRTLFDLTQDGLVIGQKLQRLYPDNEKDSTACLKISGEDWR